MRFLPVLFLLVACGGKREVAPPPPAPATVEGLAALPAEATLIVGVNAPKLRSSSLVRRAYAKAFVDDPGAKTALDTLMARCQFDPARDLVFSQVELKGAWPVYRGVLGLDATWKTGYPDAIVMPEEIKRLVNRRWAEYGIA